jgi:hypothetical protein
MAKKSDIPDFSDEDVGNLLKKYGPKQAAPAAPAPASPGIGTATAAETTKPPTSEKPTTGILGGTNPAHPFDAAFVRQFAKLGIGLENLAGQIPGVSEFARENVPGGVQRFNERLRRFSQQPDSGVAGTLGSIAPWLMTGGKLGAGSKAEAATQAGLTKLFGKPRYRYSGGTITPTTGTKARDVAAAGAGLAGTVAARGAGGALGGVAADPEHPGRAAIEGAVAGQIPGAIGGTLQSPLGRMAGAVGVPTAIAHTVGYPLTEAITFGMISPAAAHYIARRTGHGLHSLRVVGQWIMDTSGRIIGSLPAGLAGEQGGTLGHIYRDWKRQDAE